MYALVKRFVQEDSGATGIEYGLIVALIFLAIVAGVKVFAGDMLLMFDYISTRVSAAISG